MGGGRNAHREEQVKGLNAVASAHGAGTIRENAGRSLVRGLVAELLALELTQEQRDKVSQHSASYEASFGEAAEEPQPEANEDAGRQGFRLAGVSATMERASPLQAGVHLHAYLHLNQPFQRRGADALRPFAFEGIRPHLEPNRASGKAFAGAIRLGHFYVVVNKVGSLLLGLRRYGPRTFVFFLNSIVEICVAAPSTRFNYTTYPPFQAYAVEGWWLDNLLKGGKLTRQTYLTLAAQVTVGFQKRLADCKAAERFLREGAVHEAVREAGQALAPTALPMRVFDEVEARQAFVQCHDGSPRFRRPVLAIVGGTRLGKSMLAADILGRIARQLGLPGFLEVTVEESEQMDLAEFDRREHAGVILDGVSDAYFLKRHREALQGRPKALKSAKSATNVYAYTYSFCGRAVVATLDLSAENLGAFDEDHWLRNRDNVIYLKLQEPAYILDNAVAAAAPAVSSPVPERARKRQWRGSPARGANIFG
eukprot:s4552_g1.t1